MTRERQSLGRLGEELAEDCLCRGGLCVLERRYRDRRGEIDLIARDGETVVFVEVKARAVTRFGPPAAAVTARKRATLARVALGYLTRRGWLERRCRFDVVEVVVQPTAAPVVRHHRDAFRLWRTG